MNKKDRLLPSHTYVLEGGIKKHKIHRLFGRKMKWNKELGQRIAGVLDTVARGALKRESVFLGLFSHL